MGRYINTALGQRWTDEPYPDEPSRLQYPSATLQALGRVSAKVDMLVREAAKLAPPAPPTSEDAWDLSVTLAGKGTEGLPKGSMWSPWRWTPPVPSNAPTGAPTPKSAPA
jgi:hypothetical protein